MSVSQGDVTTACEAMVEEILGSSPAAERPAVARMLVDLGYPLRSEFRSEAEAEAFWAHIEPRPCMHNGYHRPGQCPEANA